VHGTTITEAAAAFNLCSSFITPAVMGGLHPLLDITPKNQRIKFAALHTSSLADIT